MRGKVIFWAASILILFGLFDSIGNSSNNLSSTSLDSTETKQTIPAKTKQPAPACDGTLVTKNCKSEGITYQTYIHHPAVPEKTHTETITTYKEEVTGYCTLCNDGTYSPSCATGRGACSHHGGVAQWNAPQIRNVPVHETRVVVDAPAQAEYYEKIEAR